MSRVRRSSWSSFLLGAWTAAAVAVGSGALFNVVSAASPPRTRDTAATHESAGYATPEDAVSAYMEALQQADLQATASAFAIETYAANYDFTGYLELIRAYSPTAPIKLPASDPFNVALNIESRSAQVVGGILYQYLRLCCPDLDPVQVQALPDDAAVAHFVDDLSTNANSEVLTSIDSFTFVPLEEVSADTYELYTSDRNEDNIGAREAVLGADELTDLAVRFRSRDGDVYALFSVVRYGDQWWLSELGGTFATLLDISLTDGGIVPVDQTDQTDPAD
jgi:hypothetical protein